MEAQRSIRIAVSMMFAFICSVSTAAEFAQVLKEAQNGDCRATHNVGVAYATGAGVAKNAEEAKKWFLRAAQQGSHSSMYSLGIIFRFGQGTEVDPIEAAAWYALAATYISQINDEWLVPRAKVAMYARAAEESSRGLTDAQLREWRSRVDTLRRDIKSANSCG